MIKDETILDVSASKYQTENYSGEGIVLDIRSRDGYRETVGCVISSILAAIEGKNLSGKSSRLTEYEKVVLSVRAYCNRNFHPDDKNEILIITDNYNNLINRKGDISKVKDEIRRKLFVFFNSRAREYINGLSLYCSMYYDISIIRDSLSLLKEIGDIKPMNRAGTWDAYSIDHWHEQYRLMPEIYKEMETEIHQKQSIILNNNNSSATKIEKFDFFICHASEDKDLYVRELANKLKDEPFDIWYDEFSLSWGDSLRQSIEKGLKESKHGIVVLSDNFFAKDWPQRELDGLFELESQNKKILPIWLRIDRDGIAKYSPILAGRLALKAKDGFDKIINEAKKLLGRNQ